MEPQCVRDTTTDALVVEPAWRTGRPSPSFPASLVLWLPGEPEDCLRDAARGRRQSDQMKGAPNGIRTRAAALKGRCPGPLDDGGAVGFRRRGRHQPAAGTGPAYGKTPRT